MEETLGDLEAEQLKIEQHDILCDFSGNNLSFGFMT